MNGHTFKVNALHRNWNMARHAVKQAGATPSPEQLEQLDKASTQLIDALATAVVDLARQVDQVSIEAKRRRW